MTAHPRGHPLAGVPPSWRDHEDAATTAPAAPGPGDPAAYGPIGAFQGEAYRRNAFARHTEEEVEALWSRLGLRPGTRVLDAGCGDGRHLRALARRGVHGVGLDVSPELVAAATAAARHEGSADRLRFAVRDLRELEPADVGGPVDVVLCLCQGGFGTSPTTDPLVLSRLAGVLRPGGRLALTVFHALFAARHLVPGDAYDPVHGVHHQRGEVRGPDHRRRAFDLWTTAYTVGEIAAALAAVGCRVDAVSGAEPGRYGAGPVRLDDPELLVLATALAG